MRWLRDPTGRFPQRPYYDRDELDQICEQVVTAFLVERYGHVSFPISTNDLTIMVERDVEVLDLYADLTDASGDVEGVTDFFPGQKPRVRIANMLYQDPRRENRLRTTLTHEYGHVRLHNRLYAHERTLPLFEGEDPPRSQSCQRTMMMQAPSADWLEWQAGYACGSFLMPISAVRNLVQATLSEGRTYGALMPDSPVGLQLIHRTGANFQVSSDAARVRLSQLGYLTDQRPGSAFTFN